VSVVQSALTAQELVCFYWQTISTVSQRFWLELAQRSLRWYS